MALITVRKDELRRLAPLSPAETEESLTMLGLPVTTRDEELDIEVTPNRPDLLSVEGIARVLNAFANGEAKEYRATKSGWSMSIDPSVKSVRPFVSACIVKNVRVDDELIRSMMQLQEKIHDTFGRKRRKVAIGIHDIDRIEPPLKYAAYEKTEISFLPLDGKSKLSLSGILERHPKGIGYGHLVPGKGVVITEGKGRVISFPPIINAELTRVNEKTRNLLIDVTGTSEHAVDTALNIVATALADRGGELLSMKVGSKETPVLKMKRMALPTKEASKVLGLKLSDKEAAKLLKKMGFFVKGKNVLVPPYRTDIMHAVDLAEDIGIAYDYNKLEPSLPSIGAMGKKLREREEAIHQVMTGMGFSEVVSWSVTSTNLLKNAGIEGPHLQHIENPLTEEFNVVRPAIFPLLLSVFSESKNEKLPQMIYELGAVADPHQKTVLSAAVIHPKASFSEIKSFLSSLLAEMGVEWKLKEKSHPSFIEGRCGTVIAKGKEIGIFGEIHPAVLNNFELEQPVAVFEIEI